MSALLAMVVDSLRRLRPTRPGWQSVGEPISLGAAYHSAFLELADRFGKSPQLRVAIASTP